MNLLLDTHVVSEATRPQPSAKVLDWIAAQNSESLFISAITLGEFSSAGVPLVDPWGGN